MNLTPVDRSERCTAYLTIARTQPHFSGDKTSLLCTYDLTFSTTGLTFSYLTH